MARADQRVKGGLYLRGLLLDGRRKSMQPMAGRLGMDHQQLQQFMTSSTWPVDTVRARLARRAVAVVRPQVWVVDDTGFPKDGTSSPGVARQYSGTLGKVGNCQIGVSVHAASDAASCPLSWRLFLPGSWDGSEAAGRRARCRVPESEHHRPKWQLALDMLDELATVGLRPAVLVADAGYGANADFRHGLEDCGLAYALQVKGEMAAHAETVAERDAWVAKQTTPPARGT
ncbi:IS701 family transposase [Streptomyces sp. NBC_01471]|uniref:IS701 family transposase n=1 Tax=Streptomyces sp. NBC_01471 TaxID=2903879 RepID=UPI00324F7B6A